MTAKRAGLIVGVSIGLYAWFLSGIAFTATSPAPDFPNYYYSATSLAEGGSIYADFRDRVISDSRSVGAELNYFADPPPVVVLFYPFRWISYEVAWWLLIGVSAVAMMATVLVTGVELGIARPALVSLAAASLLTTGFRFLTLTNHFEALLALLAALGWVRLRRRGSPGLYWGIAASLKLFPALWTVALLRNRRAVGSGFMAFAGVVGLATAVVGVEDFARYVTDVMPRASQWYESTGNYSLMSVGSLIGGTGVGWVLTVMGVIGFGWTMYRLEGHWDALYVSGVAWSLLLSPLSWLNYLVVAISPMMVAVPHINWSVRRQLYPGVVLLAGLLAMRPIVTLDSYWLNVGLSRIPTLSLLLLAVWAPALMARGVDPAGFHADRQRH